MYLRNSCLYTILFILILGGNWSNVKGQNIIRDSNSYYTNQTQIAIKQGSKAPEESYLKLENCLSYFSRNSDTLMQVNALIAMSNIQTNQGKYSLSFDNLWEAKYLANQTGNKKQKAESLIQLGKLYADFNMVDQAISHLNKAVNISKSIYANNKDDVRQLIACYMNLAVVYRTQEDYDVALNYLDSCFVNDWVIENNTVEMPFIDAERGFIYLKINKLNSAEKHLQSAINVIKDKYVSYAPCVYMYMGEYQQAIEQPDSAIAYLQRSFNYIRYRNQRPDLRADVLQKLSEVYASLGKIHRAYTLMGQSRAVADSMLALKNETNRELFEIKNTYLKSISQKNVQLETQETIIKQNQKIQTRLKIILSLVVVLALVLFLVIRMRLKLRRTILDKKEAELQSKLKEEKSKAAIESKSKELTSYALQLIDKDSAIDELLEVLKKESSASYNPMKVKLKKGSDNLWDEFNLRFTEVNSAFYDRLKEKHPSLSQTEQKHCALIKLKFATKEMARILNIEIHSVHMSRSRIRKKIGLERHESLEAYIEAL